MPDRRKRRLSILSPQDVEQIINEAIQTLEEIGVYVENDTAIELLDGSGAKVSDDRKRVFISAELCDRCVESAPSSFSLFNREGDEVASIGGEMVIFDPGSAAISVYDFAKKQIRKPNTKDAIEFVALTDQLPSYAAQSTGIVPNDVPDSLADRYRLFLSLVYGSKPVITGTFEKDAFGVMLSMLIACRGGTDALAAKPLAIFDCCPSPPLMWSDLTCQALIDCARNGVPAETVSMPLSGATAPVTITGSLVQHTAESLSGLVIHQLANPGAPIVYGGAPAIFDMRKATTPLGAVETMMIDIAYAQIGKTLGLPVHAYMGLSDAKLPDYQAGFETAMGATLAALAGVNIVSGPGMLNFVSCQSLEKLVLDHEICAMTHRLIDGIAFRETTAGFDALKDFADSASRSFMTTEHTRRFFRDEVYYPSDVVDRGTQGDWEQGGSTRASERAHAKVRELLDNPELSLADDDLIGELEAIITADAKNFGVHELPDWRVLLTK
ncbi:MAG: trimethylamine methyltransferase family protein [Candidatus Latescibacterota bacterium]|nr:MAG: trimethylamine methyltransferase family protein [Candidatus Latescibacterota bacterium]